MKKIIYFFASLFVVLAIQSCSHVFDEDGNPLVDMGANQGGLTGARFLYQEVNSIDTLAEYRYSGLKLMEMKGDSGVTKLVYSGDLINKITYNGVINGDSLAYTQFFNYDATASKITTITEVKSVYPKVALPTPPPVKKYKSLYTLKYKPNNKLDSIIVRIGQEIPLQTFAYTSYDKTSFSYSSGINVSKVEKNFGGMVNGVFGPITKQYVYNYTDYDAMKNPYSTLLPFAYIVSKSFEDPIRNFWFSANNPKKIALTKEMNPTPTIWNTQYTYDPQGYPKSGFGINYDYRPF